MEEKEDRVTTAQDSGLQPFKSEDQVMEDWLAKESEGAGKRETREYHVPEASKQEGRSRGPEAAKTPSK